MAVLLEDGRVRMSDGRIVSFAGELTALDICEIVRDCQPKYSTRPFTGTPAFISGGGGGGGGAPGPAGPPGPPGPPGPAGEDIYAATYVVNPTGDNANFTTLEDALAAVPADGAYIYLREGTYTPPAGGYVMPSVPVKIYGSGRGATIFDLGSAADRAFVLGSSQYSFGDFSVLGDGTVGQVCFFSSVSAAAFTTTTFERVAVGTSLFGTSPVEIFYDGNGTQRQINCMDLDVYNGTNATGFFIKNAAAGFRSDFARCKVRGTPSVEFITFSSVVSFVDCLLFPAFPAADAFFSTPANSHVNIVSSSIVLVNVTLPAAIVISGTGFIDACVISGAVSVASQTAIQGSLLSILTVTGSSNRIVGNRFSANGIAPSVTLSGANGANTVADNSFDGNTDPIVEIQVDNDRNVITGNTCFAAGGLAIAEGVAATNNVYDGNIGLTTINPMNAGSIRNGWRAITTSVDTLLTEAHRTVLVATAGAPIVITLPPAANVRHQTFTVKKIDAAADTVTVTPDGAETIDGAPNHVLAAQWDAVRIISDGTAWFIEAQVP